MALLLLAMAALLALVGLPAGTPWWRALDWGGPATLLVAALLAVERSTPLRWPGWLLRLGDASYAIYLVHGFVLAGLASLHPPAAWALLAAALALSIGVGLAVHQWVERPVAAWLGGRRRAGVPASAAALRGDRA